VVKTSEHSSSRISCIIPTLNRSTVLLDTIGMLLTQSCPAHEIIVVDQTLTTDERTGKALQTWHNHGLIQWLHQIEPNASQARNSGALAATGNVLLFLDDDIRIKPDFLAAYAETFERIGAMAVSGQVLEGEAKTVDELHPKALDAEIGWLYFPKNYSKECETTFMISCNVAIRHDIFLKLGGMDERYERGAHREESDFAMRFIRAGYRFYYNPKCSIYHLGAKIVQGGGARSWKANKELWYFHHCIGDWYFFFGYCSWRNYFPLLNLSLRTCVRRARRQLWRIPITVSFWVAGMPVAALRRFKGPILIKATGSNQKSCKIILN